MAHNQENNQLRRNTNNMIRKDIENKEDPNVTPRNKKFSS